MADFTVIAKPKKQREIPKEGLTQAVLAEVQDRGIIEKTFEGKTEKVDSCRLVWQVEELDSEGKRKIILARDMRKSLDPKSNLFKRIFDIYGKNPPMSLAVSKLIGANAQLLIVHVPDKDDPTIKYANIKAVMKHDPSKPKLEPIPIEWKSKKDDSKPSAPAPSVAGTAVTAASPINDDDIPF
jgi:hypothetical protein